MAWLISAGPHEDPVVIAVMSDWDNIEPFLIAQTALDQRDRDAIDAGDRSVYVRRGYGHSRPEEFWVSPIDLDPAHPINWKWELIKIVGVFSRGRLVKSEA